MFYDEHHRKRSFKQTIKKFTNKAIKNNIKFSFFIIII